MKYFPIFLKVENQSLVVFGGGADAAAKLRLLQKTEAQIYVVAETLEADVLDLGQATWVQTDPMAYDLPDNTALVYAATGDEALDARLAAKAQAHGALACAVDQKDPSDFATPALVDRDPVVVAIGTEGAAPVLARQIKARIEEQLEPDLGQVAEIAHGLRPQVATGTRPGQQRRQFWKDFFARARRQPDRAHDIGQDLLKRVPAPTASLSFIDVPHGRRDLDRQARAALDAADLVIFDAGVDRSVLELTRREAVQLKQADLDASHVAEVFQDQGHVVHVRSQAGPDLLSETAAGFGLIAQIYPKGEAGRPTTVLPYPLAKAA